MHILETYELIGKIVSNDARNRLNRCARRLQQVAEAGKKNEPLRQFVGYLPVDEEVGPVRPCKSVRTGLRSWEDRMLLHFVDESLGPFQRHPETRYVYWFDVFAECKDATLWDGFRHQDVTFHPTAKFLRVLWKQLFTMGDQNRARLPALPLYDLKEITGNRGLMQRIETSGAKFDMATYQKRDEVKSIERMVSDGFITGITLPGEYHRWDLTTVDEVFNLQEHIKRVLQEGQTQVNSSDGPRERRVEASEHADFLAELKAQCYAIKGSYGNHVGKAVFDLYKEVAKYLSPN